MFIVFSLFLTIIVYPAENPGARLTDLCIDNIIKTAKKDPDLLGNKEFPTEILEHIKNKAFDTPVFIPSQKLYRALYPITTFLYDHNKILFTDNPQNNIEIKILDVATKNIKIFNDNLSIKPPLSKSNFLFNPENSLLALIYHYKLHLFNLNTEETRIFPIIANINNSYWQDNKHLALINKDSDLSRLYNIEQQTNTSINATDQKKRPLTVQLCISRKNSYRMIDILSRNQKIFSPNKKDCASFLYNYITHQDYFEITYNEDKKIQQQVTHIDHCAWNPEGTCFSFSALNSSHINIFNTQTEAWTTISMPTDKNNKWDWFDDSKIILFSQSLNQTAGEDSLSIYDTKTNTHTILAENFLKLYSLKSSILAYLAEYNIIKIKNLDTQVEYALYTTDLPRQIFLNADATSLIIQYDTYMSTVPVGEYLTLVNSAENKAQIFNLLHLLESYKNKKNKKFTPTSHLQKKLAVFNLGQQEILYNLFIKKPVPVSWREIIQNSFVIKASLLGLIHVLYKGLYHYGNYAS